MSTKSWTERLAHGITSVCEPMKVTKNCCYSVAVIAAAEFQASKREAWKKQSTS
jgi:hypothetical protein